MDYTLLRSVIALLVGCWFGYSLKAHEIPREDKVRQALYVACAHSRSFDASETQAGACNRLSIDTALSTIYGGPQVVPSSSPAETQRYEYPLVDLSQASLNR